MLVSLLSALLLATAPSAGEASQEIAVVVELPEDTATVGDRVPVSYTVSHPDTIEMLPIDGRRDLGDVCLIGEGIKGGGLSHEGVVTDTLSGWVVPFRVGEVRVPRVELLYRTVGGLNGSVEADSSLVHVRSVLPDDAKDIRPLKPNIRAPSDILSYVLLGFLVSLLAAGAVLAVRFARRRRRPRPIRPAPPAKPAHETALEELRRIESLGLLGEGRFKEYYSLISGTIRKYIGERFGFDTMELTTGELVRGMRRRKIEEKSTAEFSAFLERSDLVKFAKLVPPFPEMESAIESARDLVRRTAERAPDEGRAAEAQVEVSG
jgi:hypothetical protein